MLKSTAGLPSACRTSPLTSSLFVLIILAQCIERFKSNLECPALFLALWTFASYNTPLHCHVGLVDGLLDGLLDIVSDLLYPIIYTRCIFHPGDVYDALVKRLDTRSCRCCHFVSTHVNVPVSYQVFGISTSPLDTIIDFAAPVMPPYASCCI
jgi:hypothetical protein